MCESQQVRGFPWNFSGPIFSVLKYGSTPNHQRVKGLEYRAVEFEFGLGGNVELYEECAVYPDSGKS